MIFSSRLSKRVTLKSYFDLHFRKEIEEKSIKQKSIDLLENVSLKTLLIKKKSKMVGKTIRESEIRERIRGMVVGLERKGNRILNPDPDIQLQAGDLLFIVGEAKYLKSLHDVSD